MPAKPQPAAPKPSGGTAIDDFKRKSETFAVAGGFCASVNWPKFKELGMVIALAAPVGGTLAFRITKYGSQDVDTCGVITIAPEYQQDGARMRRFKKWECSVAGGFGCRSPLEGHACWMKALKSWWILVYGSTTTYPGCRE